MIHIAIGTKAQFIKMAPIMQRLKERNIEYNLIDLGQHSLITKKLREEFGLKEPNVSLSEGENIAHIQQGLIWILKLIFKGLNTEWVKKIVFLNKDGICLIQGDTVSTLLALCFAKRAGIKTAHIEAGVRSYHYLDPFPEEILRVLAMQFSDILFAPTQKAWDNLKKMGLDNKTILTSANTSLEATFYSLNKKVDLGLNLEKFALLTVHRMQNIFSKKKLCYLIDLIENITAEMPLVFIQHPPTINQLNKFNLQVKLNEIKNIYFFKILSHAHFIHLLNKCEFIITDGGGIQEESYFLDKPCLFLRERTEWTHTVGKNVILSNFSKERVNYFLKHYSELHTNFLPVSIKPSEEILNKIEKYI